MYVLVVFPLVPMQITHNLYSYKEVSSHARAHTHTHMQVRRRKGIRIGIGRGKKEVIGVNMIKIHNIYAYNMRFIIMNN